MLLTKDDVFIEDTINPHHYCMPVAKNESKIRLQKTEWTIPEFSEFNKIKVKNFFANRKINWKVIN